MKIFLVDSNILIDVLRGDAQAAAFVDFIDQVHISVVTAAEILVGSRNKAEMEINSELLNRCEIIYPDTRELDLALDTIKNNNPRDGIEFDDALIAASAISQGMTLATRDGRHFKNIERLKIYAPY